MALLKLILHENLGVGPVDLLAQEGIAVLSV
jgi:hypothetical protein